MKTQFLLVASLASVCLLVSGDVSRPVLAQVIVVPGPPHTPQVTLSPATPHLEWTSLRGSGFRQGGGMLSTLQGDVVLKSFGGMPISFTCEGGFLVFKIPGQAPQTIRVPMDAATMKVSVTALGTVFEDAKNDKLTVEVNPTS